jgi:glycosyltransferase involved in cell wall biosynthesis
MYSVIIPSIGRVNYLNELLESIYNQTLQAEEIIIILDNTKKCKEIEKQIIKKDNLKIFFSEKFSLSQKRNLGVEIAKTDNIIFSDDDDIWEINKAFLTIESLKNSQVVCHAFSKFGSKSPINRYNLGKNKISVSLNYLIFGDNIFGGGSGIAGKKNIFLSIPFNKYYLSSEDYDWWIRILLADIKVEYLPESLVKYRIHNKNMTRKFLKIYSYNIKIFNKIFFKSIILFFTFFIGYFKIATKISIKVIKIILIKSNI